MKKLLTAIAMSIALFQPITAMAATATEASVKELLQVTKSEQMLDQVSAQMDSIMSQSIQQVQKQQGEPLTDALGHVVHGDIAVPAGNSDVDDTPPGSAAGGPSMATAVGHRTGDAYNDRNGLRSRSGLSRRYPHAGQRREHR